VGALFAAVAAALATALLRPVEAPAHAVPEPDAASA
jgi:hypothetical protein